MKCDGPSEPTELDSRGWAQIAACGSDYVLRLVNSVMNYYHSQTFSADFCQKKSLLILWVLISHVQASADDYYTKTKLSSLKVSVQIGDPILHIIFASLYERTSVNQSNS